MESSVNAAGNRAGLRPRAEVQHALQWQVSRARRARSSWKTHPAPRLHWGGESIRTLAGFGVLNLWLLALFLPACSAGSGASSDGGAEARVTTSTPTDGGDVPDGRDGAPETTVDSGGVCCPVAADFCCGGGTGGWALNANQCPTASSCDGWLYNGTDSHGCPFIGTGQRAGAICCECPTTMDGGNGD
jgi:hypothetical protein